MSVIALLMWACTPESEETWTAPVWDGDGLPSDTTTPPDGRDGSSSGGGDTGEDLLGALASLYIVDGAFGVRDEVTGLRGYLVLSAEPISCATAMTGADFPYGAYILLDGPDGAGTKGGWDATYRWCGAAPCMQDGFWTNSGASGDLPAESQIVIEGSGPHTLTVQWDDRPAMRLENCQDADAW